jgi:hypothetical protein
MCSFHINLNIVGQATLKAALSKVAKREKACSDSQHAFILFVFDTFGFLAPKVVNLLQRVQRDMHSNVASPRSTGVVFKSIGFAIQKGLMAHLLPACLPFSCNFDTLHFLIYYKA